MNIPRCQHIKPEGTQCGSPALRERECCYYHENWYFQRRRMHQEKPYAAGRAAFDLPMLEDATAVQLAVEHTARAILEDRIDLKRANAVLFALKIASINLKRMSPPLPIRVVTDFAHVAETGQRIPPAAAEQSRPAAQPSEEPTQTSEDVISIHAVAEPPSAIRPRKSPAKEFSPGKSHSKVTPSRLPLRSGAPIGVSPHHCMAHN